MGHNNPETVADNAVLKTEKAKKLKQNGRKHVGDINCAIMNAVMKQASGIQHHVLSY